MHNVFLDAYWKKEWQLYMEIMPITVFTLLIYTYIYEWMTTTKQQQRQQQQKHMLLITVDIQLPLKTHGSMKNVFMSMNHKTK